MLRFLVQFYHLTSPSSPLAGQVALFPAAGLPSVQDWKLFGGAGRRAADFLQWAQQSKRFSPNQA